jgi:Cu-Zn family superoxide dismutase
MTFTPQVSPKLTGMVHFETQPSGYVRVRYHIGGLQPGWHPWHVHQSGDLGNMADGSNSGVNVQGHFIGVNPVRPAGKPQEVGLLGDGVPIWADAQGFSRGEFIDTQIRLNGPNGIVGRSVVVHGNGLSDTSTRVAMCAIGKRAETAKYDADLIPVGGFISQARAHVSYTSLSGGQVALGYVQFTQANVGALTSVNFDFAGLTPSGTHPWHVHQLGDLLAWDTVSSVAKHFVGQNPSRTVLPNEVGLLNDGAPLVASATGTTTGSFTDSQVKLNGINSIVGRAVVVHVSPNGVPRMAWGVIGMKTGSAGSLFQPCFWLLLVILLVSRLW